MIQPNFHSKNFGLRDSQTKPRHDVVEGGEFIERTMVLACPQCGSSEASRVEEATLFSNGDWPVVRCDDCGLMYSNPRPRDDQWEKVYPSDYRPHQTGAKTKRENSSKKPTLKQWRDRLAQQTKQRWHALSLENPTQNRLAKGLRDVLIDPYLLPTTQGNRLLDFGCGSGQFLARMSSLGWRCWGMDSVKHAVQRARLTYGLNVTLGSLPGATLPQEKFDVITAWQVLEHLSSPIETCLAFRQLLERDGRLVISVPNQAGWAARYFGRHWMSWDLPRHLLHFDRETLPALLTKSGFDVLHIGTIGHAGWVRHSARRAGTNNGQGAMFSNRFLSGWASRLAVLCGQGESLLAVARPAKRRARAKR